MAPKKKAVPHASVLQKDYDVIIGAVMSYFSEWLFERISHHGQAIVDHILAMELQLIRLQLHGEYVVHDGYVSIVRRMGDSGPMNVTWETLDTLFEDHHTVARPVLYFDLTKARQQFGLHNGLDLARCGHGGLHKGGPPSRTWHGILNVYLYLIYIYIYIYTITNNVW